MNPGTLLYPIELMIPSGSVTDQYGTKNHNFSGSVIFAKLVRKSGGENVNNGIYTDHATYTFLVRYRTDIDSRSRVKFEGREYQITFIAEPVRKAWLELTTERNIVTS